jgi:hypothetical protein
MSRLSYTQIDWRLSSGVLIYDDVDIDYARKCDAKYLRSRPKRRYGLFIEKPSPSAKWTSDALLRVTNKIRCGSVDFKKTET